MLFQDTFSELQKLWGTKLITPLEEEKNMIQQIDDIRDKNKDLKGIKDTKNVQFMKFNEENQDSKELRDNEITTLRRLISEEHSRKEI